MTTPNEEFLEAMGIDGETWAQARIQEATEIMKVLLPAIQNIGSVFGRAFEVISERCGVEFLERLERKERRRRRYQRRYARIRAQMGSGQ